MRQPPLIIGIYAPAPQSGKTTVAEYLERECGYVRMAFAGPLKAMFYALLHQLGTDSETILRMEAGDKNYPFCSFNPTTLRRAYQTLGTEWGRDCIGKDFWSQVWESKAHVLIARGRRIVVDDMRFANEFSAVSRLGGQLWQITRPGADKGRPHASEAYAPDGGQFDTVLHNDGSIDDLRQAIQKALQ